jgi:hypothetical protein
MPFAKHESFYIREGWLFKGLRTVSDDPTIFVANDAAERLGLGKNMVRALRYWMQATGLTEERWSNHIRVQSLTRLGELIWNRDPYLELDGTLWLIHHQLVCSRDFATAWYWFFNHYAPTNFTRHEFIERLSQWVITQNQDEESDIVAEGSLRKDFDCLIHTYVADRDDGAKSPEDQIESPLTALGLLTNYKEFDADNDKVVRRYRFQAGTVNNISPLIFLYILLSRQEAERSEANQVSLSVALREPMNVGRTFNIGMRAFEDLVARLEDMNMDWGIRLVHTGNLDQLTLPDISSHSVLEEFYEQQAAMESSF